jgi:hypothetical protein
VSEFEDDDEETSPLRRLFEQLVVQQPPPPPPPPPPMAAAPVNITGDGSVFPARFDGTHDGIDWLGNFELYCRYKGIIKADGTLQCEEQIKSLLAVLLTDGAKLWFDTIAAGDRDTWAKLRALFVQRFAEQKFLKFKHSKEMFTTKQGSNEPVLEYVARIQSLARKSSDAPNVDVIIHAVMSGVKGYIAGYLAEKAPATLADLIKHASVAESTLGDAEPVSAAQLNKLQQDMKTQFEALSLKLTGSVANVAEETTPRVRFAKSRSPSADRRRYSRLENETRRPSPQRPVDTNTNSDRFRRDSRQQSGRWNNTSQRGDRYHWFRGQGRDTDDARYERCPNCDGNVHNDFTQCPSYRLRCRGCSKWGHVVKCCRSRGQNRGHNPYGRGTFQRAGNGARGNTTHAQQY